MRKPRDVTSLVLGALNLGCAGYDIVHNGSMLGIFLNATIGGILIAIAFI